MRMWASSYAIGLTEFSLSHKRLKPQRKAMIDFLRDLLFADDCELFATSQVDMRHMVDLFSQACKDFGLTFSRGYVSTYTG